MKCIISTAGQIPIQVRQHISFPRNIVGAHYDLRFWPMSVDTIFHEKRFEIDLSYLTGLFGS
jgi:hypothetical protein